MEKPASGHSFTKPAAICISHGLATIALRNVRHDERAEKRLGSAGWDTCPSASALYRICSSGRRRLAAISPTSGRHVRAGWRLMALKSAQIGGLELRDGVMFSGAISCAASRRKTKQDTTFRAIPKQTRRAASDCSVGFISTGRSTIRREFKGVTRLSEEVGPNSTFLITLLRPLLTYNYGRKSGPNGTRVRDNLVKAQCMEGHGAGAGIRINRPPLRYRRTIVRYLLELHGVGVYYRHMPCQKLERNTSFPRSANGIKETRRRLFFQAERPDATIK